ncbi:MAG: hypothetical protein F4Y47_09835 [Acidobacteriia bacterium]|nr:hypothetical protein [Terriglobia bacterium]MYG02773.1 hypothetical protein [Terriglobia bacterium]MYK11749.1 hypothetical protein [Terriglobia bacterium]
MGFFEALIQDLALEEVQIQDFGGVAELRTFLPVFVGSSGFSRVTSLGIVRDAETSAGGAFESVQGSLAGAGLPVPQAPGQRVGDRPAVTAMILPGGNRTGMLETLLNETLCGDNVLTCIDDFFRCVEEHCGEPTHRPEKARSHAYLATKRDPHLSVGFAAKRGYWNLKHQALEPLRTFLREVASQH